MYNFDNLKDRLDKYVNANHAVSGLSITIIKDDEIIFDDNIGLANIEKGYPITNHTVFRLASMTKPITGVAVLICEDMKLLKITDYIDKYIPFMDKFYVRDMKGNILDPHPYRLTIEQLLRHSSGLQSGSLGELETNRLKRSDYSSLENIMYKYKDFSLEYAPDTNSTYSATATFDILARIVEIVSNMPYEVFLKKYIFEPLGMNHTTYSFDNIKESDLAISYTKIDGKLVAPKQKETGFDFFPFGYPGGGAGLLSTKEDYLKFMIMLLNEGEYQGKRILSKESFKKMLTHSKVEPVKVFGLSVHVRTGKDWEHLPDSFFGWSGAYGTHFFCSTKYHLGVLYLHNSHSFGGSGGDHVMLLEDDICDIFNLK